MTTTEPNDRLTPAELSQFFLFESLDEEKLNWLAENGRVQRYPADATVYGAEEPATCFFMLIEGTMIMYRRVGDHDVETTRSSQPGAYSGATRAWLTPTMTEAQAQKYAGSVRTQTECSFFQIPADDFGAALQRWFPMAMPCLRACSWESGRRTR